MQVEYSYLRPSGATTTEDRVRIDLSTSGGAVPHPFFFSGFLSDPRLAASLLLSVSKVAATRYHVPAAMRDAAILAADPVVTADGERLRFESFSSCGSVYARADLLDGSLEGDFAAPGTTNVDFSSPMRNALAQLRPESLVHLIIGDQGVGLSTPVAAVVERRVCLPSRWARGFGEVQVAQSRMVLAHDLNRTAARRFLSALAAAPRSKSWWAVPGAGGALQVANNPEMGAMALAGIERFRILSGHAGRVERLRAFDDPTAPGALGWVMDFDRSRLTVVLSADARRGFSGEGGVLAALVDPVASQDAKRFGRLLASSEPSPLGAEHISHSLGLAPAALSNAADVAAATGHVGYDLAEAGWYARRLPYADDMAADLHPRLRGALALGPDAVKVISPVGHPVVARVRSHHDTYTVSEGPHDLSCTCLWSTETAAGRGPCKHILAVKLARPDIYAGRS